MIECTKFKFHVKGYLQGFADFYIKEWGLEIKSCSLYRKDGKRWINFPAKEFTTPEGEKAFAPLVKFREKDHMTKFTESAKESIDIFCKENQPQSNTSSEQPQEKEEGLPF